MVVIYIFIAFLPLIAALSPAFYFLYKDLYGKTDEYKYGEPCVTFKQFLSFYNINNDRWLLRYDYVICKSNRDRIYFKTNRDVRKYKKFRDNEEMRIKTNKSNKVLSRMVHDVKEDISSLNEEIDAGYKQVEDTYKNMVRYSTR